MTSAFLIHVGRQTLAGTGTASGTRACCPHRRSNRRGLTLYEVLLALVILLGSTVVIGQIISTGSRAAVQAQLQSEAILRCQTKLSEVVAGIEPLQSVSGQPFQDAGPEWSWSLQFGTGPHIDLLDLEVTVAHTDPATQQVVSQSLRRYLRDPQVFLDATAAEDAVLVTE